MNVRPLRYLRKILDRYDPPKDIEKAVGHLLLTLPRCTSEVRVASPDYGDEHYRCDVLVNAVGLLPWAERHSRHAWVSDFEQQAAMKALPLWLRGADAESLVIPRIPMAMVQGMRAHILDFFNANIATVICRECGCAARTVDMRRLDERRMGGWIFWTSEWTCGEGHLLYREEHDLHFHPCLPDMGRRRAVG